MAIDRNELKSRLWTEWTNGLKITANSLGTDQIEIINSACTCPLLGDENFVQKAVIYVQRKIWIGKFSDYKTRIGAYEKTILELLDEVRKVTGGQKRRGLIFDMPGDKLDYRSTLDDIIIDGDTDLSNESWGDHAIAAYEKLGNYVNGIMDILDRAQKALEE